MLPTTPRKGEHYSELFAQSATLDRFTQLAESSAHANEPTTRQRRVGRAPNRQPRKGSPNKSRERVPSPNSDPPSPKSDPPSPISDPPSPKSDPPSPKSDPPSPRSDLRRCQIPTCRNRRETVVVITRKRWAGEIGLTLCNRFPISQSNRLSNASCRQSSRSTTLCWPLHVKQTCLAAVSSP